jgi:hypothetical protein
MRRLIVDPQCSEFERAFLRRIADDENRRVI